jgi:glycerophosphoryl diester phosphodiesterase
MRIIAHRGASAYAPENTSESFELAIRQGASMIELDVHRCASGQLVVIHDETLARTTSGTGFVADKTLDELKSLDAGNKNQIPSLEEIFELINRRAKINIEIKGKGVASSLAELLSGYLFEKEWNPNFFIVSSFDHDQLRQFHALLPRVRTGILYERLPNDFLTLAHDVDAFSINLSVDACSKQNIEMIHQNGLEAWVYTINEPAAFQAMKAMGVDAVFTNNPDRFL